MEPNEIPTYESIDAKYEIGSTSWEFEHTQRMMAMKDAKIPFTEKDEWFFRHCGHSFMKPPHFPHG